VQMSNFRHLIKHYHSREVGENLYPIASHKDIFHTHPLDIDLVDAFSNSMTLKFDVKVEDDKYGRYSNFADDS
jgi:hypothetical protein